MARLLPPGFIARLVGIGFSSVVLTGTAAAEVFDPVTEFSVATNTDTSRWSYRFSTDEVRDGDYSLFTSVSSGPNFWNPDHPYWFEVNQFHGVGANNTGATINSEISTIPWPTATIWMHPGTFESGTPGGPGFSVVSWLAPAAGTVDIAFTFTDMDTVVMTSPANNGVQWFVDLGDSTGQIAAGTFDNGGTSGLQIHNGIPVQAGDRLHFILDPINGNRLGDSTEFTGSVDFTPAVPALDPLALALLALLLTGTLASHLAHQQVRARTERRPLHSR